MKVDDVLQVGPLDADGEGLGGVEDEGHQAAGLGRRLPALDPGKDSELELAAVPPVKVDGVLAAGLWCHQSAFVFVHNSSQLGKKETRFMRGAVGF